MTQKRKVLIVSPQASRVGHGAFHGQRTLEALHAIGEWETVFLTGQSFRERTKGFPLFGEIIEAPVDFSQVQTYRGTLGALKWGLLRRQLQDRLFRLVDDLIPQKAIDAVFMLDGDIGAIYTCYQRNKRKYPEVKWAIAHSTLDFWITDFSVRSLFKAIVSSKVKRMSEEMGATLLYVGEEMKDQFCDRLKLSQGARSRIVLTNFGCDPEDRRISREAARRALGLPVDAKVALFFGLLRADKRPEVAIEAAARANQGWWLLLAGQPYSYTAKEVDAVVQSNGLSDRSCLMLRYLDEDEVRMVFSAADVLLLPHNRSIVSNSGPLSMARSYRLPVIVNNVGSMGESVTRDGVGFVAQVDDLQSFFDQLIKFGKLTDPEIEAMQERIENAAARYSFLNTAQDYSRALEIAMSEDR